MRHGIRAWLAEHWWLVLWTTWGVVIAALIAWLDHNWLVAALWLAAGITIGSLPESLAEYLLPPFYSWYREFWRDEARDLRLFELCELEGDAESEEFERLIVDESFDALLAMPPILGVYFGALLGGVGGALIPLDPESTCKAWQGAALGVVTSPWWVSFLVALMFALMVPVRSDLPLRTKLARRALMAVSPVLAIPAVWHCLRWFLGRWTQGTPA